MKRRTSIVVAILIAVSVFFAFFYSINPNNKKETQTEFAEIYPTHTTEDSELANLIIETQAPKTGHVIIQYKLVDGFPKPLFGSTYTDQESLFFTQDAERKWSTIQITPNLNQVGPLFRLDISEWLSSVSGDCPINTYIMDGMTPTISFEPLCENISPKETASITLTISNCVFDAYGNTACGLDTSSGRLNYKLNKELDEFEFNYSGSWSYSQYPLWINQATQSLGFPAIPENFYDTLKPGEYYTISKNNK